MVLPRPGRRTFAAVAGLALAGVLAWGGVRGARALVDHPALVVREVTVRGAGTTGDGRVLELAGVAEGEPWLALDRAGIARRVRRAPFVERVRVRRPWVGRVRIDVEECASVARVRIAGKEYGLCPHLRILPAGAEDSGSLPRIEAPSRAPDAESLARGLAYLGALRDHGIDPARVHMELSGDGPDRIRIPAPGLLVTVERGVAPRPAVRNLAAFLEELDGEGEARGRLRVISETTAVWRAA